jgi:uncharacterized protein (TIGR03437 family)
VVAIAAGTRHSIALKSDGTVVAWGDNQYGQARVPPDLAGAAAIAAGDDLSLALPVPISVSVSAASYLQGAQAPNSIGIIFGSGFADQLLAATTLPLPSVLGGTRVTIHGLNSDLPAQILFVSPGQINFIVPPTAATGSATIRITRDATTGPSHLVAAANVFVASVSPGLFSANANGRGVPAAIAVRSSSDGTQVNLPVFQCGATAGSCAPVPVDLGAPADDVVLVLYGSGIQGVSSPSGVTVRIGGVNSDVLYSGPQGSLAGLDQINVRIPRSLAGTGNADIALTVDGIPANIVSISIR